MGLPATGYSWPQFEAGNTVSVRHGAWSKRRTEPLAAELVAGLLADRPDLAAFPETVWAWARAEARCTALADHFATGLLDSDGNERPGLRYVAQFERLASDLRARLGLDPRSEAELAHQRGAAARTAVDLEAIRAKGRAHLEARANGNEGAA